MARKRFTEREVIETLLRQDPHMRIRCFRCCTAFELADIPSIEREHLVELGLGGEDTTENCAYSHKECHSIVTNGTKATTAGSSKHRIAKTKRIAKGGKKRRGRKIPSRPFGKRLQKV